MQEVDLDQWAPLYEPNEFNEAHGPLVIDNYRLSEEELRSWAERCTNVRVTIVERSKTYLEV